MTLPLVVNLQAQTNTVVFNVQKIDVRQYPVAFQESPIVASLTVDTSKTVFAMAYEMLNEAYQMQNEMTVNVSGNVPNYTGEYTVIPKANSGTVLATRNKMCTGDITVTRIQTAETHNDYGVTFYIAEVT